MQYMYGPGYTGLPMDIQQPAPGQGFAPTQNPYGYIQGAPSFVGTPQVQQPRVDPRVFETPEITMGETHSPFTIVDDNPKVKNTMITVDNSSDMEVAEKKKRAGNKKNKTTDAPAVRVNDSPALTGDVEGGTIYTYNETNAMLHDTLNQIDSINIELVKEFESVKHNRTMKNKYMVLNNLSENIGSLISNRIATIREINNCITKANDMDYKKYKDVQAAQGAMSDDKYVADMYQAFLQNPQAQAPVFSQLPQVDSSILGSGIVRANMTDMNSGAISDAGYLSYVANLTPEQNMMRYENDPNIKQVVVYDASSGNKFFQYMNMATGEAINNVPTYDNIIMEDTTLDIQAGIAKNININETFPIVVINDNVSSQY